MKVPYRLPGSSYVQWVDLDTRLTFERIIFLDAEIDDNLANYVVALLLYLSSEDATKPIYLYINSPGELITPDMGISSISASLSIYDTLQYVQAPVHTICLGQAIGTAAMLLAAGTKGSRASLPHAEVVLSQLYGRTRGQATDIQINAKKVLDDRDALLNILSQHTGQPLKKIASDIDRRFYLTPQNAKDYGLIDQVLESAKQLPKSVAA